MVIAYAGRRAQSFDDIDAVAAAIARRMTELAPSAVVGALADGADLLIVEAALAVNGGPAVQIVLPTPIDVFRASSVEPEWRERFDRALEASAQRGTVRSLGLPDGADAYRRANTAFLDEAVRLAGASEPVLALAVARPGEGEMVEGFLGDAGRRGIPWERLDPAAR
jgi:hypothetical protein